MRREFKFTLYENEYGAFIYWLNDCLLSFGNNYPDRVVNSIYLDTFDNRSFEDNISGVSKRSKVRIRWYDNLGDNQDMRFEVKNRSNSFGWKILEKASSTGLSDISSRIAINKLISGLRGQLSPTAQRYLDVFCNPTLHVEYKRQYFESQCGSIRLTVDRSQKFRSLEAGYYPIPSKLANQIVIEIKVEKEVDNVWLAEILTDFPFRRSRNSKYVNGRASYLF